MRKALVVAWWALPAVLWACGSGLSSGPGVDAGTDSGRDGTVVEAGLPDSATDRVVLQDGGANDVATHDVVEEVPACLPESTDDAAGVYVVSGGSMASNCGARSLPCATVALGLASAEASVTPISYIYIGPGTFPESTQLTLLSGVSLVGGWSISTSTVWSHTCLPPTIQVTTPILAPSLTSPTTLDTLDIVNTAPPATPGGSLYGVMSEGSSLVLNQVSIQISNAAGAGAAGGAGGGPGASGGTGCTPGSGDPGGPGATGTALSAGTFTATGYEPTAVSASNTGQTGVSGGNGTAAPTPTPVTGTPAFCVPNPDPPPTGSLCQDAGGTYSISGMAGEPGCGGSGGPPGLGGSGGGCSIALYVWGGSVTITGGGLSATNGGAGGAGGAPGDGGGGGTGTTGASTPIAAPDSVKYCNGDTHPGCTYPNPAPGTTAGNGGSGGTGGPGGGGAGGCSYAYYAGNGATVTTSPGAKLTPGAGGAAGTPNGVAGPADAHN
jgi:hypothetical protein